MCAELFSDFEKLITPETKFTEQEKIRSGKL